MKKSSEIIKLYYQYQFTSSLKQNCIIKIHPDLVNKRKFCILINRLQIHSEFKGALLFNNKVIGLPVDS